MTRGLAGLCAIFLMAMPAAAEPKLVVSSDIVWTDSLHYFGGFSGVEVSADGQSMTVISDQGFLLDARILRENQTITGIERKRIVSVNDKNGNRVAPELTDSEGLAIDSIGNGYISFEEHHRVMQVDLETGISTLLPSHPDFPKFAVNAGFEALAIHPDGTLFATPENTVQDDADFPLYAMQRGRWSQVGHFQRRGPFQPVGADFSDDGLLYLLERAATPLGFRTRVRRFDLDEPILTGLTLLETSPSQLDNMEALTLWTDPSGHTRVILLADDNYLNIQRTQVVEFVVHE